MPNPTPNMTTFAELNLHPNLVAALPNDCQLPTAIQAQALPSIIDGQDVLALAPTGSGKTLAFGLGLLQQLSVQLAMSKVAAAQQVREFERFSNSNFSNNLDLAKDSFDDAVAPPSFSRAYMQAVIIVPTRELAAQISTVLTPLAASMQLNVGTLCGGVDLEQQVADFNQLTPQLVVATPGRLLDLLKQKLISLKGVQHLVLDEADRLLEMGFWPDVQKLMSAMPALQQQLLFSATLPNELAEQLQQLSPNAHRFAVGHQNSVVAGVAQTCYLVNKGSKAQALIALLKEQLSGLQVLVFINARDSADSLSKRLNKAGIVALALHGEKDQTERDQALLAFKQGDINVLVATDLLARGIDVTALPVVVNLDLPESAPVYVHRVGRTARAGLTGMAISLVSHGEAKSLAAIRELTGEALPLQPLAGFAVTDKPSNEQHSKRPPRDKKANRRNMTKRTK
ncbi:DEAD/DEAH box helicase [Oceanisphaera sp. W20_SRM_FM3]|uniref:DEAD/DEAH box helicase n=1 Tax=Oceanisphaera sp. W20_SRM_FM3 TaxID=3240267 RepID=UPI003F9CB293